MPLTKKDVMDVLADPVVLQMDFWIGIIHISGSTFNLVRAVIDDEDIGIEHGTSRHNAYYDPVGNTLTTQNVNAPLDLDARALLLHECTHALIDVYKLPVTRLSNEVSAYIAQHVYLLGSNPNWKVAPNNAPWQKFFENVAALVKKFNLHTSKGRGAKLQWGDFKHLRPELNHLNIYRGIGNKEMSHADGVPAWF